MTNQTWLTEKPYYNSEEYFLDLTTAIANAKNTIEFETYIFQDDSVGKKVLQALIPAARRGVEVRMLIDGVGSFFYIKNIKAILANSQVQLKVYHPFFFTQAVGLMWFRIDLILRALLRLNRRLHRKMCLIDGHLLFAGSLNITNDANRESAACVSGSQVLYMRNSFERIWSRRRTLKSMWPQQLPSLIRLNDSFWLRRLRNSELRNRIRSAQKRVWVTNAYFVPPVFILRALYSSKLKCTDIRLILPARSDQKYMKLVAETYYRGLLHTGIRIFEYKKCFLHAKTLVIDDWVLVGSSNMNHRSLFHDLEVDIVLTKAETLESIETQFKNDIADSVEITFADLKNRPIYNSFIGWFVHLLRYWL